MGYPFTSEEEPFAKRIDGANFPIADCTSMDDPPGAFVGWFGIVRGMDVDRVRDETRVYLEGKYFDGLTDTHILCVDFNGGGDFVAVLRGTDHPLLPVALVRVYGTVTSRKDGLPRLRAEYARQFDWGEFTFMFAKGDQKGSERWRALADPAAITDDDVYDPGPDVDYYVDRLGPRSAYLSVRPVIPVGE
jgi:hypothetical protein